NLFTALAARTDDALSRLRRGDLLSRLGDDAQELGDHVIKALVPAAVAVVMGVAVLTTFAALSPPAALAMLAALVLASVLGPLAAHRAARLSELAVLTTRSGVSAQTLEILDDATSLRLEGRLDGALDLLQERQAAHDAAIDRAALPAAIAAATVPLSMILAVSGALLAGADLWSSGAASAGQIGILLLLPLSSLEAATALPAAASQRARSRAAAERLSELVGPSPQATAPDPAPAAFRRCAPSASRRARRRRRRGCGSWTSSCRPERGSRWWAPPAAGSPRCWPPSPGCWRRSRGASSSPGRTSPASPPPRCAPG